MPEDAGPAPESVLQTKRSSDTPNDEVSAAKRIKQSREEIAAMRKAEKERKEAERRAEKDKREAEKRLEKERKELERKAEKEKKETERKAEKERKENERRAEKERKEAEKAAEKERKEAERLVEKERKLKAQPSISLFFKKTETSAVDSKAEPTPTDPQDPEAASDYRTEFLPFHEKIDGRLFSSTCNYTAAEEEADADPVEWLKSLPALRPRTRLTTLQFRSQLALAQESSQVTKLLGQLRLRRLQFSRLSSRHIENSKLPVNEEQRPPYVGTTRDLEASSIALLAANPFRVDLDPALNYEYDSEAEWDQEEGEDLRDEDGEDSDEDVDDSEEMRGFLSTDEDEVSGSNRQVLVGPLTPVVIWGNSEELAPFSVELVSFIPLDPDNPFGERAGASPIKFRESGNSGNPDVNVTNAGSSPTEIVDSVTAKVGFDNLKKCMVLINGNQANKTLLIELMKQQLPSATEKEVRSVLESCAERVGKKKAEKRWVLRPDVCSNFGIEDATSGGGRTVPFEPSLPQAGGP